LKKGLIAKDGASYAYVDLSGKMHKYSQKDWAKNTDNVLNLIMEEFHDQIKLRDADSVHDDVMIDEETGEILEK
jgi:hypothetical protein